jgi:hypothetical protein
VEVVEVVQLPARVQLRAADEAIAAAFEVRDIQVVEVSEEPVHGRAVVLQGIYAAVGSDIVVDFDIDVAAAAAAVDSPDHYSCSVAVVQRCSLVSLVVYSRSLPVFCQSPMLRHRLLLSWQAPQDLPLRP